MNEQGARDLVLAWAVESSDAEQKLVTPQQRQQLRATAWAHAQMQAAGQDLAPRFLSERAALLLRGVAAHNPALSAFLDPRKGLALFSFGLPLAALLMGLLGDRLANLHRVDLLSPPLLLIIGWNMLMYAALVVALVRSWWGARTAPTGWLVRSVAGLMQWLQGMVKASGDLPPPWPAALGRFVSQWSQVTAPLLRLRVLRVLHLCAAALGLGVAVSLYLRGVWVQYQVGWESTFLDATQVSGMLDVLFAPAAALLGLPGFSTAEVQALQWPQPSSAGGSARWVHLYAASLLLWVVLPRCVLAAIAYAKERRLARRFRIDPAHPYVRDLLGEVGLGSTGAVMRVFPYSFTVDGPRIAGLQALARQQLGAQAQLMLQAITAYGEDIPSVSAAAQSVDVALFNLSATPEAENHGDFLDTLVQRGSSRLEVWVDASAYQQRLASQSGSAGRLDQRSALWRSLGAARNLPVRIVHLVQQPDEQPGVPSAAQTAPVVLA